MLTDMVQVLTAKHTCLFVTTQQDNIKTDYQRNVVDWACG